MLITHTCYFCKYFNRQLDLYGTVKGYYCNYYRTYIDPSTITPCINYKSRN